VDDDLSAQGSDLRARQTKRSSHVPEKLTPTPAFNLSVGFNFLAQGLEGTGSLSVGKNVQQPKQFPVDASGRGDNGRHEGVTQTVGLVPPAILVNLLLGSLHKLEVDVLMAQGSQRERLFPPVTDSTGADAYQHQAADPTKICFHSLGFSRIPRYR
jgi:hypothetical protein